MLEKPAFKNAIKRRRCLIPADGYYEWQRSGSRKRPYFIHRRDGAPFGFAGLAETWIGPNGEELDTVAIVTAPASADLAVAASPRAGDDRAGRFRALAGLRRATMSRTAMPLLTPPREGEFVWHEISTRVNRVANDDAQLILPITDGGTRARATEPGEESRLPRKAAPVDDR